MPPVPTNPAPVVVPPVEAAATTEYVVVKGDTLGKIAKKNGVKLKDLEDANPGIVPTRLKIGQKLTIPAATGSTTAEPSATTDTGSGGEVYVVKSGDTLTRIARHFGTTIKAIEAENNLTTTKIKVGQKLNIPTAAAPAPTTAPAPAVPVAPAPVSAAPAAPVTPPDNTTPAQ